MKSEGMALPVAIPAHCGCAVAGVLQLAKQHWVLLKCSTGQSKHSAMLYVCPIRFLLEVAVDMGICRCDACSGDASIA
jgi:hypothetical protein